MSFFLSFFIHSKSPKADGGGSGGDGGGGAAAAAAASSLLSLFGVAGAARSSTSLDGSNQISIHLPSTATLVLEEKKEKE